MCHQWPGQFWLTASTQQPHSQLKAPEKTGQAFKKKHKKKTKTGTQKWVPKTDPKMGPAFAPTIRILLKPESEAHFWVRFLGLKNGTRNRAEIREFPGKNPKKVGPSTQKKRPAEK